MLLISNDGASARRKQKAVRKIALSLVQCVRLKRRRAGAGAKRKMSEEEEIFLSECIEERASIHGRRSEGVLFYGKRLKQKDLLSIVNYKRLKMGKDVLKSAKTVLNRGHPKNKRSLQAKCHNVGKWLFCSRAPPKTRMDDRIHTRHQRQARKLLKMDAWSTSQKMVQHRYLYISKDDKAYLRPGTSVGATGIRKKKMYMSTDMNKQPALPIHDFADSKLFITPAAHRVIKSGTGQAIDGDEQLETVEDQSLVTIRPKFFVGSSGSVWASDFMMLRSQRPDLFEIPDFNLYRYFPTPLRQFFAKINDSAMYFMLTNLKEDLSIIMRSVDNVKYHAAHLDSLQQNLEEAVELVNSGLTSLSNSDKDLLLQFLSSIETVKKTCGEINNLLQDKNISAEVEMKRLEGELKMLLLDAMHKLKLPPVRPRIIESTDAGPGVGSNNFEVRFRDAEIALLHNSSIRSRIHLATDDQGQNEAERTNSYIGDAIADGSALKTNYVDKYHGLTEKDLEKMSVKELEEHENEMAEHNTMHIVEDVCQRINDEPGPGGCFMQAFVTNRQNLFFHNTSYLKAWHNSGERKKQDIPGHYYFKKIWTFFTSHYIVGELFLEYRKGSCSYNDDNQEANISCEYCSFQPMVGLPPDPFPRPVPDITTTHYKKYLETPRFKDDLSIRDPDDYQPRARLKEKFNSGNINSKDTEKIQSFSKEFLVEEKLVNEYLLHLQDLKFKRDKREKEKQTTKVSTKRQRLISDLIVNKTGNNCSSSKVKACKIVAKKKIKGVNPVPEEPERKKGSVVSGEATKNVKRKVQQSFAIHTRKPVKAGKKRLANPFEKGQSDVEDFDSLDDDYAEDGRDVVLNEIRSLTDDEEDESVSITFIPDASSLLGSELGFTDILQSAICKVGLALEDLSPTDEATSEEDVTVPNENENFMAVICFVSDDDITLIPCFKNS